MSANKQVKTKSWFRTRTIYLNTSKLDLKLKLTNNKNQAKIVLSPSEQIWFFVSIAPIFLSLVFLILWLTLDRVLFLQLAIAGLFATFGCLAIFFIAITNDLAEDNFLRRRVRRYYVAPMVILGILIAIVCLAVVFHEDDMQTEAEHDLSQRTKQLLSAPSSSAYREQMLLIKTEIQEQNYIKTEDYQSVLDAGYLRMQTQPVPDALYWLRNELTNKFGDNLIPNSVVEHSAVFQFASYAAFPPFFGLVSVLVGHMVALLVMIARDT